MIFYGLKTCDTCRRARKELSAAGIDYTYKDVRADGVSIADVTRWAGAVDGGWEKLLNKSSTTWRGLDDSVKTDLSAAMAAQLMVDNPTLIKRPLIEAKGMVSVGWTKETKALHLG